MTARSADRHAARARLHAATAALHRGHCVEFGTPDYAAEVAEAGADYAMAVGPAVDTWDWQRQVRIPRLDGKTLVETYGPTGAIYAAGYLDKAPRVTFIVVD